MPGLLRAIAAVLAAGILSGAPATAQSGNAWAPESFTLSNGMRAVVLPDHRAPVITHMIWYRVGSADEAPGKSGLAHFLEHLMFKATTTRAAGEYSKIVARNGGQDNAGTFYDFTNYHFRVAKDRLPLMMRMEADRMVNLQLADAEVLPERGVVQEERRQNVDSSPAAISSMPALQTTRGPKRSASTPAPAPPMKYTSPHRPNTSDTSARRALNWVASDSKNAAKEYDTPKITASAVKQAHTTTQAWRGSSGAAAAVAAADRSEGIGPV